jgi:leucyl aminopeptidase
MAGLHGASCEQIVGGALTDAGLHMIHAVGRAGPQEPRLIDLRWGDPSSPRVTLVGKGVCFDTGGLDVKNPQGMLLMKKDMGGAACALGLAQMIMTAQLPLRLRVLIPAVENSIDARAYRPGDILRSRKGLTVEIGNTDAEGRLVLADALALADEEAPELLFDLATLTGAARVALGPDLPALFSNDEDLARSIEAAGSDEADPLWRMPLWADYDDDLASKVADLANVSTTGFAGAVIGGLFLQRFVSRGTRWAHLDLYGWNPRERPGRPVGGRAQGIRALYRTLERRYRPHCG